MINLYYNPYFDWLYILQPNGKVVRLLEDGGFEASMLPCKFIINCGTCEFVGSL